MNIELFKVFMSPNAPQEVEKALTSGFIGQGPRVEEFERLLRKRFDTPYINTVNSCTSGLELAVQLIKDSDPDAEIITSPLTCTATTFAILSRGVKIKWADVDPKTCNVDLDDVARKITPHTKAIMVVHWGGYPVDLDRLEEILEQSRGMYDVQPYVIEDCAHAWGSKYKNRFIGHTNNNFCVFSFQAIKHLTTGDGGIIISPNEQFHYRAKLLRWYGLDRDSDKDFRCKQNIKEFGFKWHMNDIAAAIGISNLAHTDEIIQKHKDNGQYYNKALEKVSGVKLLENKEGFDSSYWIYTMMVENREGFMQKMKSKGIATGQVHDRNDKHDCLKEYKTLLPNLDKISKEMCCIPSGWWVKPENRDYIVDCIKQGW